LLVIAFAAYLIYGGVHEFAEASGSELLEVAAPLAAVIYGCSLAWVYLRDQLRAWREREPDEAAPAEPATAESGA
jgi:peptidoglycan/LPS O-acetylase OafA/YrhL